MTSHRQIEANRRNAYASTGPKTPEGKALVARNAVRHGLRSERPVLPGERREDWEAHRAGILRSLVPIGTLEEALAERVALCLWRLRRVVAYETATTALAMETVEEEPLRQGERLNQRFLGYSQDCRRTDRLSLATAEEELAEARDNFQIWEDTCLLLKRLPELVDSFSVKGVDVYMAFKELAAVACVETLNLADNALILTSLGVPEDALPDVYEWDGWTAAIVRRGLERIANAARIEPEKLLARALNLRQEAQSESRANVRMLEKKVCDLRRSIQIHEYRLCQRRMLPAGDALANLLRYETHLSRQMLQALHELQRCQAARAGQPAPLPAALDVTVDVRG